MESSDYTTLINFQLEYNIKYLKGADISTMATIHEETLHDIRYMSSRDFRKYYNAKENGINIRKAYKFLTGETYESRVKYISKGVVNYIYGAFNFLFVEHWKFTWGIIVAVGCTILSILYSQAPT